MAEKKLTKQNEQDILTAAEDRFKTAETSDKVERDAFYDDICFEIDYNGCQWNKAIRKSRERDTPKRPCLVINKIPEKTDQVEGEFRKLRPSINVKGVDNNADPIIAEIFEGIIRHIEYNSTARAAYNTSHGSTIRGGRGAWRIDLEDDYDDPFVRNIVINRIPNVLTAYWDQNAKKLDRSDANYFFITETISDKEFKAQYPDESVESWSSDEKDWQGWRGESTVRIAEYWWKQKEKQTFYKVRRIVDGIPNDITVKEVLPDDLPIYLVKRIENNATKQNWVTEVLETDELIEDHEKTVKVPRIKYCKMTYKKILKDPDTGEKVKDWPGKFIPVIVEIGKETNIKGEAKSRGMVRFAKTPQEQYNILTTSNTEHTLLAPKAPYLATPAMIANHKGQWDQAHIKNYMYLLYDPDLDAPGLMPKREPAPQINTAVTAELMRMEHDIMSSMGIYQATLGDRGPEESGVAIGKRQRQSYVGSYSFDDNFGMALTHSARILIDLIPKVYDTERMVRIRGEDDTEKLVPINARPKAPFMGSLDESVKKNMLVMPKEGINEYVNDLGVGKYDIVATIGPSYTTQREEAANMINDLMKSLPPEMASAIAPLLVKNIDIPGAQKIIEILKKTLPQGLYEEEEEGQEITPQMMEQAVMQAVQQAIEQFKQSSEGQALQAKIRAGELEVEKRRVELQQENVQLEQERQKVEGERLKNQREGIKTVHDSVKGGKEAR